MDTAAALDLEERIGGRWLQHAGMVVLVLGVAFFLRYAFDHEWLSPAVRVAPVGLRRTEAHAVVARDRRVDLIEGGTRRSTVPVWP